MQIDSISLHRQDNIVMHMREWDKNCLSFVWIGMHVIGYPGPKWNQFLLVCVKSEYFYCEDKRHGALYIVAACWRKVNVCVFVLRMCAMASISILVPHLTKSEYFCFENELWRVSLVLPHADASLKHASHTHFISLEWFLKNFPKACEIMLLCVWLQPSDMCCFSKPVMMWDNAQNKQLPSPVYS